MMILQKNRSVNNYFEIHGIDREDILQIEMLRNNSFRYIADCRFREIDNEIIMLCKLDGMSTLFSMINRGSLQVSEIMHFLCNLSECLKEMQEYILSPDALIIDSRYILYDPERGSFRFIIVPGEKREFSEQFKAVMEELLHVMDHSDRENVMFIYDFFSGNVLRDNFTAELFIQTMERFFEMRNGYSLLPAESAEDMAWSEAAKQESIRRGINMSRTDSSEGIKQAENSYGGFGDDRLSEEASTIHYRDNDGRIKNIGLYCAGGVIVAVGVILSITYGLTAAKIVFVVVLIYMAALINRILKTREEERLENDMNTYSSTIKKPQPDQTAGSILYPPVGSIPNQSVGGVSDDTVRSAPDDPGGDRALYDKTIYDKQIYDKTIYDSRVSSVMTDSAFSTQQLTESPVTRLVPVDLSMLREDNQIFLRGDRLTVGRTSSAADYCIAVPGVSRVHAELIKRDNSYMVNDLNSTNGTYVNSVRITGPTRLCYGDIVSFATVDFYCM